jgi:catecholate siderophore receptor
MPFRSSAFFRVAVCLIASSALLTTPSWASHPTATSAPSEAHTYVFEITSGPLDAAIAQFEQVAGATVMVAGGASIEGLSTAGVSGVHTADQALELLVSGTGLQPRVTGVLTYALVVQVADEGIEVTGRAPYEVVASDTATRTYTPLRDVPQAVTVITRAMIADQSMQGLADAIRYVPGIGVSQGEGNRDAAIFRGNNSTGDFFVDGVRDDVQYFRDLYNVDTIEALKGPNAMIFGRGGAGGVINRTTRQADWSTVREATLQTGSWDNRRAMFDVGNRLGGRAAVRATAMYENSGSYRDDVSLERYGINPTFAFALAPGTIVRAGYEHFHDERTADRGVPSWNGRPFETSASTFFGNPAESDARAIVDALTAGIDHRFGRRASLRNRTRLADYDKFYQNVYAGGSVTPDGSMVPIAAYNNATGRQNLFSQTDLNVAAATGRIRHTLVLGTELGRQVTTNYRETGYFGEDTSVLVPTSAPRYTGPVSFRQSATDADNHGTATIAAVYAQDQLELSRHVQAVVGVRYDDFRVNFTNDRTGITFDTHDRLFAPRAGLIVKPVEAVSLYTSYSLAYVPRAGDQLASLTLSNEALEPEQFRNYELGAKWDVRPTLSFTTAVFRLDRTNVVVPDPVDPTRSLLVDGQRTNGVEIGSSGALTGAWRLTAAYSFQDGVLTHSVSPAAQAGAVLAQLPRHTFSIWNRFDFSRMWAAGVGLIRRGDMFASTDNTVTVPASLRLDAAVFVHLSPRLRAQVNLENAFDTHYYASAQNNFNITPGAPRAVRVTLTTRF